MQASEKITLLLFVIVVAIVYATEASLIAAFTARKLRKRPTAHLLTRRPVLVLHALAMFGVLCFLYGRLIEPCWIEVTTVPIQTDKLKATTFRIVHISDLHCDNKPLNEERAVELINDLKPDVIVFTGDALNTASALPLFKRTMKNLNASLAKFAVRGNFDTRRRIRLDLYCDIGFELLDAKTVPVAKNGETIYISGLSCANPSGFQALLSPVPRGNYSVFLYHYPDLVESLEDYNVDLYLCGHTHGGQVALPLYGALITLSKFGKKYESGLYNVDDTILYVNRGLGLEPRPAPQVRFCARPEITVFDIAPKQ